MNRPSNYEDRHPQDRNEERMMPLSDINDLDEVVRVLGIQDSHVTPADAVRDLQAEIETLRTALNLIAAFKGRTLLNMDLGPDGDRAYQLGANAAFEQAADIAIDARTTPAILGDHK